MVWIVDQPSTQTELASQFRELMNCSYYFTNPWST